MSGVGEVCGAASGGILALGLLYGQDPTISAKARDFSNRFSEKNGGLRCNDLLGFGEGSVDELVVYAKKHKGLICDGLVSDAVSILLEIIQEAGSSN